LALRPLPRLRQGPGLCCAPRLAETPFSGCDPQEGDDDDDRDSRTDWVRSGPGWAHVAQTQARCGAAYAPGGRSRDTLARPGCDGCNPERMAGHLRGGTCSEP